MVSQPVTLEAIIRGKKAQEEVMPLTLIAQLVNSCNWQCKTCKLYCSLLLLCTVHCASLAVWHVSRQCKLQSMLMAFCGT